jgi:hypothetical protein
MGNVVTLQVLYMHLELSRWKEERVRPKNSETEKVGGE